MDEQTRNTTARVKRLVKSLQDLGVHAGSPSQVIESLKTENVDLRKKLRYCEAANKIIQVENGDFREWLTRCQAEKQEIERQRNEVVEICRRLAQTHRAEFTPDEIEVVEALL